MQNARGGVSSYYSWLAARQSTATTSYFEPPGTYWAGSVSRTRGRPTRGVRPGFPSVVVGPPSAALGHHAFVAVHDPGGCAPSSLVTEGRVLKDGGAYDAVVALAYRGGPRAVVV